MLRFALVLSALCVAGMPAVTHAAPAPTPPSTTLFMHGPSRVGEIDSVGWLADVFPPQSPFTLDTAAPKGSDSKSMSYVTVFNDQCTGQPFYPTFQGALKGTISGDLSLDLHFLSAPATLTAQVWVDTGLYGCDTALKYIPPHAKVLFDVPAGQSEVTVTIPNLSAKKRKVRTGLIVMILAPQVPAYGGQVGRILYDSTATPSRMTFACTPAKGATTCA